MRVIAATLLVLALFAGPAWSEKQPGPLRDPSPLPAQDTASVPEEIVPPPLAQERAAPPKPHAGKPKGRPGCIAGPTVGIDPGKPSLRLGTQTYRQTLNLCDYHIVLTFDDGPSPETTPLVLKALREAGVHANFFLIGRHACRYPDLAREEFEEGHVVGHHSNTHPSFTLRGFDEESAERDIENGIAADEAATGGNKRDPSHPHVPFFRFPGFADTKPLLAFLEKHKISVFGSDLWAGDWIAMSPEHERQRILDLLDKRPHHNGIILFHDTRMSTALMLPDLLRDLKAKSYQFVQVVSQPDAPPPALVDGPPGQPLTERVISHLHTPIVPGQHTLDSSSGPVCTAGPAIPGEEMQP